MCKEATEHAAELNRFAYDAKVEQRRNIELRAKQSALFDAIQHGDEDHKVWLKQAISDHFAGKPVEPPRGKGNKEALVAQLKSLSRASKALRDDLINRAKNYEQEDAIPVVAPGNGVWCEFCEAIKSAEAAQ